MIFFEPTEPVENQDQGAQKKVSKLHMVALFFIHGHGDRQKDRKLNSD